MFTCSSELLRSTWSWTNATNLFITSFPSGLAHHWKVHKPQTGILISSMRESGALRAYFEGLQRSRELLGNFMSSPQYARQMEQLWLQGSRVVQLLTEMSRNAGSGEGWVRLDAAGQALWANAEEDMSSLQAMYGYNKLKPLVVASQVFEVRDEPLSNGGSQASFRIKRDAGQRPEN